MRDLMLLCTNLLSWLIGYGVITYWFDNKDFNKGVCPKCGKPFMIESKEGLFNIYRCGECINVTTVTNPYLNWRYGRKLKQIMSARAILKKTYKPIKGSELLEVRPLIECNDGFSFSMQAGYGKYSEPRKNLKDGNYDSVEIGFPSESDMLLDFFADDIENTYEVYPYVPVIIVDAMIHKHGGVKRLYKVVKE